MTAWTAEGREINGYELDLDGFVVTPSHPCDRRPHRRGRHVMACLRRGAA